MLVIVRKQFSIYVTLMNRLAVETRLGKHQTSTVAKFMLRAIKIAHHGGLTLFSWCCALSLQPPTRKFI